ncbi:hypothetical protein F511_29495 [Dorcoceras hygrometricum]|uniref:Uncharacterized protein n=1 Tax=Dorcoceras hygrometricum TaxID=472368 RepID=A0A2Z7BCA7_9LAMI|nr:hypothetical protein F511_29495 [Dorcoceras hygrometricum]
MADQTDEDEVFDFSNVEFTRDYLVIALNDMVKEYRKLSHSFEEAKAENMSLKSSSAESSSDELEDVDILKTKLSKLQAENEMLKNETSELKAEVAKLTIEMSSWNKANLSLCKLYESQKQASDKTGIGFNNSEFCEGESSTQSRPAYDKFNKMSFVKDDMMYNCLESVKYDNQNSPKLNENGKAGIGFSKPERFKPNWLKKRLDKDKAKASQKPFVPNQSWHNSKKVKSGWKKFQQRRDQYDQSMKPKLKRPARDFTHTFVDPRSGKTVRIVQIWVPKGLQVESHFLLQLKVSCSGGTVASSRGDNLCWRVPVDWCTSRKVYQSQYSGRRAPVSSRSHHIDFDSVFRFDDAGIVQMFESLVSMGLMEFLGCPAIFHEQALIEFFENGSVRDGMVVSTISGTAVEISESVFATAFGLPTDGLTDLSEVPKNLLSDAQRLFSASEKEVSISCLKKEVKMPFRLLSDILAKSLFVKAGSFDAVTPGQTAGTMDVGDSSKQTVGSKRSFEELMSVADLLVQICDDMMLPSITDAEISKIRIGESIVMHDKGKGILVEDEPVQRNPAQETVELICGDVEFLVDLRDQVMADVVDFFHSFSLNKLTDLDALLALKAKEKLMLDWAETDSLETAVKRRLYILSRYREMLLRKFLDSHRQYLVFGQPWTASASQIFDLLSAVHSKSLESLRIQQQEHGIIFEQPCTSTAFDYAVDCGAVFAQFFSVAKSTCWVRPMIFVDGIWTPLQGPGFWRSGCRLSLFLNKVEMPAPAVQDIFVPSILFIEPVQYWGAAPLLVNIWAWQRVCSEAIQFSMSGRIRPAILSSDIVIRNFGVERLPDYFLDEFAHGVNTGYFEYFLSGSSGKSGSDFDSASSGGDTVYRSPSPPDYAYVLGPPILSTTAQEEKLYFVQSPASSPAASPLQESSSSSSNVSMHFDSEDLPVRDQAAAHTSVPVDSNVSTAALEDLKSYFSQRIDESTYEIRSKVNTVEFNVRGDLVKQQAWLRQIFQGACDILERQSQQMNDLKKGLMAPVGTIFQDLFDIKKNQRAQEAKLNALDGQFIHGGDAKKGESGSSSRPPPVRVERRPLPTPQSPRDVAGGSSAVRIPTFPRTTGTFAERVEQARKTPLRERASYLCRRSS